MKVIFSFLAGILFWFGSAFASRDAFIVNNLAETMSHVNLETGEVQNHVTTLGRTPNQIAYHDGYLYVVNSISADMQKIDPQSFQVVSDIQLPIGSNPYSVCFGIDKAFVTGWISGIVYRIDLTTNQIDGQADIGEYPEGIIYLNGKLFAAQTAFNPNDFSYGQGRVAMINAGTMSLETEINVGKNPQALGMASDGRLHVVCTGNYVDVAGAIYIINPDSAEVTDSVLVGGQPANVAIARDNVAYVAAGGWTDAGLIFSYDALSGAIFHGPTNPIRVGLGVNSVAADSLGYGYSCDFGSDQISKIDSSGRTLATYAVGDGPASIVIIDPIIEDVHNGQDDVLPEQAGLLESYPNPFNSQVAIRYAVASGNRDGREIWIFDILGRKIKSLRLETNGEQQIVIWDGTDEDGRVCVSGIYFARLADKDGQTARLSPANSLRMIHIK